MPRKIFLFDFLSRFVGYYESDTKAVITGEIIENGNPYIMFGGFNQVYANLPIKIEGPYGTVVSKLTNHCAHSGMYNFNGDYLGDCTVGIDYSHRTLSYGTNTFKITIDDDVLIYTIIR